MKDMKCSKMTKVVKLETHYFKLPLDEVLIDAKHGNHSHFELIITQVFDQDGEFGTGYTYTGGRGGKADCCTDGCHR